MLKKILSISLIVLLFILALFFLIPRNNEYKVISIKSPDMPVLDSGEIFSLKDYTSFDPDFTQRNKELASELSISEEEAFILGNLGKYWAENLIRGRNVFIKNNDLIYYKYSYKTKFLYSGFCLYNSKPYNQEAFEKRLNDIRKGNYQILDLDTDFYYRPDNPEVRKLKNFIILKKSHIPKDIQNLRFHPIIKINTPKLKLDSGSVKIYFSDLTTKLKPDRNCSSDICKEILLNIQQAQKSIDIAIYGYSTVPEIEKALEAALKRGVKIRLVYDVDSKGKNIYENTFSLTKLLSDNTNDLISPEPNAIMHNKFYIFDNKILITGSANLSHTDMSGFNTNNIIVINSPYAANIYKQEFEQMYGGKFHTGKNPVTGSEVNISGTNLQVYFSPRDMALKNAVIPMIEKAQKYIYIPTFLITDNKTSEALIRAKSRGVDIKIIVDALNASAKYSKHQLLRNAGILVKTENYAGKMHSKSMIIDDKYTLIGSMNFSYSGENKNDENLIVIENPKITKFYKSFFLYQWNKIDNKWLKYNARSEGKDSIGSCTDGIDNNYDGLTDMEDSACKTISN